jgi:hypothetical protein
MLMGQGSRSRLVRRDVLELQTPQFYFAPGDTNVFTGPNTHYTIGQTHKLERAFSKAGFGETDGLSKFKAIDFLSSIGINVTDRSSARIATWLRATKELQLDDPRDYLATIAANSGKTLRGTPLARLRAQKAGRAKGKHGAKKVNPKLSAVESKPATFPFRSGALFCALDGDC